MIHSNIYLSLWKKHLPSIINKLESAIVEIQYLQLWEKEFETVGKRIKSGYCFTLSISNNVVKNNISGSAVARDLYIALTNSKSAQELGMNRKYKITLDKNFKLTFKFLEDIVN